MGNGSGDGGAREDTLAGQAMEAKVRRMMEETQTTEFGAEAVAEKALHKHKGEYDPALEDLREYLGGCADARMERESDAIALREEQERWGGEEAWRHAGFGD